MNEVESENLIEAAADFAVWGPPTQWVEMADVVKYDIYRWIAEGKTDRPLRVMTNDLVNAIHKVRDEHGPVLLVWRAEPDLEHVESDSKYPNGLSIARCRLAVFDKEGRPLDLEARNTEEGEISPRC